jgi:hypothetical protein
MQALKTSTAKNLELERLRRELLRRIVRNETHRRTATAVAQAK